MTWVRLDDQFADHPKIVGLSAPAFRLHVTAICYAARQETDGVIPKRVAFVAAAKRSVGELMEAQLWEAHEDGWLVHDYLEYNPSSASLREKRAADALRKIGGIQPEAKRPGPARSRPDPGPLLAGAGAAARDARGEGRAQLREKGIEFYEHAFGKTPNHKNAWEIADAIEAQGDELVQRAFRESAECGGRSWPYVKRVLATIGGRGA